MSKKINFCFRKKKKRKEKKEKEQKRKEKKSMAIVPLLHHKGD